MTLKLKTLAILIIIGVAALFFTGYVIGHKKADRASQTTISTFKDVISKYETEIRDIKMYVTAREQEVKSQKDAIKAGELLREELRKLNLKQANEITRLGLRIDTLLVDIEHNGQVVHVDTVIIEGKSTNAILLPFTFTKSDQWLNLRGTFDNQGKLDLSLKMDAKLDIYVGVQKKDNKPVCIVTSDNKYLGVISINSQKFDLPTVKRYGIGIIGGYGIGIGDPLRAMPFVGLGMSYNIIRF